MSVQPALVLDRLFTPTARLGWVFRDLRRLAAPFGEPQPDPDRTREQVTVRAAAAQTRYARARRWLVKPSLVTGLLLLLLAGWDEGRVLMHVCHPPDSSRDLTDTPVSMSSLSISARHRTLSFRSPSRSPPDVSRTPFPHRSPRRSSANAA
jgi:hypothetical protein